MVAGGEPGSGAARPPESRSAREAREDLDRSGIRRIRRAPGLRSEPPGGLWTRNTRHLGVSATSPMPLRMYRFVALTLRQAHTDGIFLTASALAFVTILSLVPLFAAFSFIGTRMFNGYQRRSLEVFVQVLPYSDQTVVAKLRQFIDQAGTIHGIGILAFFATSLFAFATIEETFNKVWNVSRRRPLRSRLLSFALLLFWGPLVLGGTFTSLILLRESLPLRQLFEESILLTVAPFLATALGLTMLNWVVPFTKVHLRSALIGGLFAAILLELLRQGFASYVEFFRNVNIVYGSFAFLLLFMVSIELTWTIVLLGSEAAYTAQNFRLLVQGLHPKLPIQASWVALAALTLIARRAAQAEPAAPFTHEALAECLHLTPRELDRVLTPLLSHKLLKSTAGGTGYVLETTPDALSLEKVFSAYDHRARRAVEPAGEQEVRARMEMLIGNLAQARSRELGTLTLAELMGSQSLACGEAKAMPELAAGKG